MKAEKVKKPKGLAALKLSDPEKFKEIVTKGAYASTGSWRPGEERAREAQKLSVIAKKEKRLRARES